MSSPATLSCANCGAVVAGVVCAYCGTLTHALSNVEQEQLAWQAFLTLMQGKSEEEQIRLLKNGFLPDNFQLLTEAGLHCVRLVDLALPADDVVEAAVNRLRAIVAKLRIIPHTAEGDRAIAEFEKTIAAHQTASQRLNKQMFIGCLFLVVLGLAALALWLT